MEKLPVTLQATFGLDPLACEGFELDRASRYLITELNVDGFAGTAAFNVSDYVAIGDRDNIPRRIIFRSSHGGAPSVTMGIEVRDGAPACTYLELSADEAAVQAKHLKSIRIEEMVTQIVVACAAIYFVNDPERGPKVYQPEITRDDVRAVERMQRRRRDPRTDRALLERVAELYCEHPAAPNKAVAAEFGVSERTAARWAGYCSDSGLLPQASKQGQKRL